MVAKLAAAGAGAAVLGGGMVAVQNVTYAEDNKEYRMVLDDGISDKVGDLCLDGNMKRERKRWQAFLFPCKKTSPFEKFRQVGNGPDGVEFRMRGHNNDQGKPIEMCLDSNRLPGLPEEFPYAGNVYALECNGGANQKWNIKTVSHPGHPREKDLRMLQNVGTQRCMWSISSRGAYVHTRQCKFDGRVTSQYWLLRAVK
jgi:hypothetical protein